MAFVRIDFDPAIEFGQANVADVISRHAAERPYAVAIVEGQAIIHYRTLSRAVLAVGWHLRRSGIAAGDVVGVALPHSAMYLVTVYALALIGAASVALPLSDPAALRARYVQRFRVARIASDGADADPTGIPTVMVSAAALRDAPRNLPADLRVPGGERPWTIWRTSGTTSEAKGVPGLHLTSLAMARAFAGHFPGANERYLCVMDLTTAYGLNTCERTLFGGGTIVMPALPLAETEFLECIDRYAITHVALTPNFFSVLLPHLPADGVRCPSLRTAISAGMAMPESLRAEIRRRFSPALSIMYASNEGSYLTCADAALQERHPETVGTSMPGVELETVDEEDRQVPAGEPGSIRIRTPWMLKGYVDAPSEAQQRTFRNGWIYTGDVGVLSEDGMLFLKGRVDDMMNYDGIKIMPADIEAALLSHPAVAEAVAFPAPSVRHQHVPMAAVVLRSPARPEDLVEHCRRLLGARAPVALSIERTFPRNAMGKVVRRDIADRMAAQLPEHLR